MWRATSMSKETNYPGVGPLLSYKYDMLRAQPREADRGPLHVNEGFLWDHTAKLLMARVLWGLYKFELTGYSGRMATAEAGILLFPLHDFCGGNVASSAFVKVWPDAASNSPGDMYHLYMPGAAGIKTAEEYARCRSPDFVGGRITVIPDMSAYTGKKTHSMGEAELFIRRSLASSIVSISRVARKAGLFAADRWDQRTSKTRNVLRLMDGPLPFYAALPTVQQWDNAFSLRAKASVPGVIVRPGATSLAGTMRCEYSEGERYHNENSGNDVSMMSVHLSSPGAAPLFSIPPGEQAKLTDPRYVELCPQALFHN
jgi:hypothetical protein